MFRLLLHMPADPIPLRIGLGRIVRRIKGGGHEASLCTSAMQQNAKKQKHANSFHFCCFPGAFCRPTAFFRSAPPQQRGRRAQPFRQNKRAATGNSHIPSDSRSDGTAPPKSGDQRIDTGRTGTGPLPERSKGNGDSFMDWRSAYRCFGAS